MTNVEKRAVLQEAQQSKTSCRTYLRYNVYYRYYIPLTIGEKLFLSVEEDDFLLNGYTVRRMKDIKKVVLRDDKCNEILKNECGEIAVPGVAVDSWQSVFHSLKERDQNIIAEKESLNDAEWEFVVGRIAEVHKNHAYVYHFDADGVWGNSPIRIPFAELTSVTFGSRYVDIFSKYVDEPPKTE